MTILEVYKIFKEIVKKYPVNSDTYKQLQGFYVLNDNAQINTATLGKTKAYSLAANINVSYNRKWELASYTPNDLSFDFPILALFQNKFKSLDLYRNTYTLNLYVIGKYEIESDDTVWERTDVIYEAQIMNVLKQFEGFVKFEGNWVHDSTLTDNEILKCTETVKQAFKNRNSLDFEREQVGVQRLSGCSTNLELQLSNCDFLTFDWT